MATTSPRRNAGWSARFAATAGIVLAAAGVWGALAIATGDEKAAGEKTRRLIDRGRGLSDNDRHTKAVRMFRRALKSMSGDAPDRVRGKVSFDLGVALRKSGRFDAAVRPLKRSRRLGIRSGAAGTELAKARSDVRR